VVVDSRSAAQSVLGVFLMAPYKEKVEFVPERMSRVRSIGIWITGLVASFILGALLSEYLQDFNRYKCFAALKSSWHDYCRLSNDHPESVMVGVAAVAAFICIRLWIGRR
jgi:hypothetical protein